MKMQVILVDWENVQPDLLPALNHEGVRLFVFVGPHQHKLPFATVQAMQKLGQRAQYVQISKPGNDALDMHIAFYMGRLAAELDDVYFHVIAKDRDYDPLIAHLKQIKVGAAKWPDLASIPVLRRAAAATIEEQVAVTQEWLIERKAGRPKTLKSLTNSLKKSVFTDRLTDEEIACLITVLQEKNLLSVEGQKVRYLGAPDA